MRKIANPQTQIRLKYSKIKIYYSINNTKNAKIRTSVRSPVFDVSRHIWKTGEWMAVLILIRLETIKHLIYDIFNENPIILFPLDKETHHFFFQV